MADREERGEEEQQRRQRAAEDLREEAFRRVEERLDEAIRQHNASQQGTTPRTGSYFPQFTPRDNPPPATHTQWKNDVEQALGDMSAVTTFPEPPVGRCNKPACIATKHQRALEACSCDVEALLRLLDMPLNQARLTWHPDRWSKCPEEHRTSFQVRFFLFQSSSPDRESVC